jgi:ethanolamine utilization protein EutQ (cupin superfamily)
MTVKIFSPKGREFRSIPVNVAEHVTSPELKERLLAKFGDDGMENSLLVTDSQNIGVGYGRFAAGSESHEEIPVSYEEVLVVLEGSATLTVDGESHTCGATECFYIYAGSKVRFASSDGCLLLFVTTPPPWVAFENAFKAGKLK